MHILRKIAVILLKTVASLLLIAMLAMVVTGISLVYRFHKLTAFEGPDIFNPYRNFKKEAPWKRANFHTHTKVDGIFNECDHTPEQVYQALKQFNYDIVTFSNHNQITNHPFDPKLQVNLYEHGYNLLKYHKLVFGSDKVNLFDNLLPIFTFQKQFQLDYLRDNSDIVVLNHPLRTTALSISQMQRLSGYQIIELDSGKSTENGYWDAALSAGRYSFALANDDLHYPDRSRAIAVRCNFLQTQSESYQDIKNTLLDGCYYSMRIPDYGNGEWSTKIEKNKTIPYVKNIGLKDGAVYIALSQRADSIKVTGQNCATLSLAVATDSLGYKMLPTDSYSRFTAYFPEGEVIYSNPFARYDAATCVSPFRTDTHSVDMTLTLLYNFILFGIFTVLCVTLYKTIFVW